MVFVYGGAGMVVGVTPIVILTFVVILSMIYFSRKSNSSVCSG